MQVAVQQKIAEQYFMVNMKFKSDLDFGPFAEWSRLTLIHEPPTANSTAHAPWPWSFLYLWAFWPWACPHDVGHGCPNDLDHDLCYGSDLDILIGHKIVRSHDQSVLVAYCITNVRLPCILSMSTITSTRCLLHDARCLWIRTRISNM